MRKERENKEPSNIYEQIQEKIKVLYQNYDYLNLTFEKFETICMGIVADIYSDNEKISFKKAIQILQDSLDKYIQKKLKDSKNTNKIINDFIAKKVQLHEQIFENLEELRKINNFLTRYEVEETPELYSELLNNQIINSIVKAIVEQKLEKIETDGLASIDRNHNVQLLLEMYCENHGISFKNAYHEIVKQEYDSDMKGNTIDGFGLYLSQIAKPLLTKEEEQRLFILKEQGDPTATQKLIEHNLQLVVHIATSYAGKGLDILDLVQEGNMGLMNAIERFDYRKGYKLSTYATWWIRQSIQRGIMNTVRTIRLPVHLHEKLNRYNSAINRLIAQLKREPTREEICNELNITPAQLDELEVANQDVVSMNVLVGKDDDKETELEDFISAEEDDPETEWLKNCISEEIREIIYKTNLTDRERMVIIERHGLNSGKPKTLHEIADIVGVTRERIRQIEAKALRKLRASQYMRNLASLDDRPDGICYVSSRYQHSYTKTKTLRNY